MSNTPNRASNPAGKPRKKDVTLDLSTAQQMLPLVRSIVADIVTSRHAITKLSPEQDRLERHRRDLVWLERQRRYQVKDEIAAAERILTIAVTELNGLGVSLIDDELGEVDFPTRINGRPAAFTWKMGDDGLRNWHYNGEEQLRPIPNEWTQSNHVTPVRFRSHP